MSHRKQRTASRPSSRSTSTSPGRQSRSSTSRALRCCAVSFVFVPSLFSRPSWAKRSAARRPAPTRPCRPGYPCEEQPRPLRERSDDVVVVVVVVVVGPADGCPARQAAPAGGRRMMRLAADVAFPFAGPDGAAARRCRVRVYEPEDPRDAAVVVCSETPEEPGGPGVGGAASTVAARVAAAFRLHREPVWIEHRLPSGPAGPEAFELVKFATFRAQEIRRMGARVLWDLEVGAPGRKPLDRATVEALVGREV